MKKNQSQIMYDACKMVLKDICVDNKFILKLIFIILTMHLTVFARMSFVVFPLQNEGNDKVYSWISAVLPEMLSRGFNLSSEIHVYDPTFIFKTDSSVWKMHSDSLLSIHRQKWLWDVAVGGHFRIINDSIQMFFNVALSVDRQEHVMMEFQLKGLLLDYQDIFSQASNKIFSLVKKDLTDDEIALLNRKITNSKFAYETYAAGYLFEMKGNIPDALTAYSRSLEIDPSIVIASCRLGMLYSIQKKYEIAKRMYEETLKENPNNPVVVAYMADFLSTSDQPEAALQFMNKNRSIISLTSKGLKSSGALYLRLGEYQRAIALLTRSISMGPDNLDTEFLLGQAWLHTGNYERAIDIFNRLIKCRPDYLRFYSSLGSAYRKSGQLMQAAMTLQSALNRDPQDVVLMIDLSQIWIELKWNQKALQLLKQAESINPEIGDIYINMGLAYWNAGEESNAHEYFNKAMQFPELQQSAMINIGNIFFSKQQFNKAISFYKKALKIGKKNSSLEYNLAIAYLQTGKESKGIKHLDALLMLEPERIDVLQKRARIAFALKNFDEAEHYYRRILEITPQDRVTVQLLVKVYSETGKFDEAIQIIEDYLIHVPTSFEFIKLLAEIYQKRGWYDVAIEKYQEIISEFPDQFAGYMGLGQCMYEMIFNGLSEKYDETIFTLKYASERSPKNSLPDELIGDIYYYKKGYKELALDHWNKALGKLTDSVRQKEINDKIKSVK